jgi:hypothetical protein
MDRPLYIVGGPKRFRKPGGPEEWGRPMPPLHRSITEPEEIELVSHVLTDVQYRDTLFNIKGMRTRDARVLECVELRELKKTLAGDIDILVIPKGLPDLSTAIQVKRFAAKVRMNTEGHDEVEGGTPERFRKLMERGIKQANRTKRVSRDVDA